MIERYEIIELDRYPKFGVYDGKGYCLALMGAKVNAVTICDALNRLAALEAVCREIVESAPNAPLDDGLVCSYSDYDQGLWKAEWDIAQKLKAVLEEA